MRTSTKPRSRIDVIEIMERWARYRVSRTSDGLGWPKQVSLGKMMDGMPGTDCPRCKDSVTGASVGFIRVPGPGGFEKKATCPTCDGARKVRLDRSPDKANPALISGNGPRTAYDDDPLSQRVDWLICTELTEDQRVIVVAEFTWNGSKNQKIAKLRIRHSTFNELLDEALDVIAMGV